jgi:hypothetical protein
VKAAASHFGQQNASSAPGCSTHFGHKRVEPQLCKVAMAACVLLLPAGLCWPMTAIAASAASAGARSRKPRLACSSGFCHLRAQAVLTPHDAGLPPGMPVLNTLQSYPAHWYCPYLQQKHLNDNYVLAARCCDQERFLELAKCVVAACSCCVGGVPRCLTEQGSPTR